MRAPSQPELASTHTQAYRDLYADVTREILGTLERGLIPWRSPLLRCACSGYPRNLVTGRPYRGINVFLLMLAAHRNGFVASTWLTLRQANELGGRVRAGERSTPVVFWRWCETTDRVTGEPVTVPVLRRYHVFNVAQCDGLAIDACQPLWPLDVRPIEAAERIAEGYADGPAIDVRPCVPCYRPLRDVVEIPHASEFVTCEEYYSTLFHELAHSTGHPSRLDRLGGITPAAYGTYDYGREELVAEMASAFLCGLAGIRPAVVQNQAAYLQGWVSALRADKRLLVSAAAAAQRAADWILGARPEAGPASDVADDVVTVGGVRRRHTAD